MWKILLLILGLTAAARAERADLLLYRVKEPELPPYTSRILVTDAFVRLDEGEGSTNGYTLYNRVSHTFYNVDPQEQTVLVLQPPRHQPETETSKLQYRVTTDGEAPLVDGRRPLRIELMAEGRRCRLLQVLPDTLPRAMQGLRELRAALARLQSQGDPGELSACQEANLVAMPELPYEHGLPLVDWRPDQQQWLVDFRENLSVPDSLFEVPPLYERIVPPPL